MSYDEILILNEDRAKELVNMSEVIEAVEGAFEEYSEGEAKMPPKIYLDLPEFNGDFRAMPAYVSGYAGVKWVNVHPDNKEKSIPTVMAKVILSNPETGENLGCIEGTSLTNYRTGAAGGIASKYLAREDSDTLGLVGLGEQAKTQLMAVSEVFDLKKVLIHDVDESAVKDFMSSIDGFNFEKVSLKKVMSADIVSTTTPVRSPIIKEEWVKPGTHINAIGADAEGKQELEPQLFVQDGVKIVVDDIEQTTHSGEINVAYNEGTIDESDIYANLPDVVAGKKRGRESREEITVFDSTGLAIQDVATAKIVYERAIG
ncbi:ornithine cyclodeaminase family protein [Candidatus Bipolaricaulota bacterium]|nr:ornithine cyclodeaminase family protein [Candidatus Bipolaricaulota bacterium]